MTEKTIESYLELLTGLAGNNTFTMQSSDRTILNSIARQVHKGVGLTDRQYEVVKEKLLSYADQFIALEYPIHDAVKNTRIPIRQIDRARWIRTAIIKDQLYIGVRFTFNKRLISALEALYNIEEKGLYDKVEKIHYFIFNEINLHKVISELKEKSFEIDSELQERYNLLEMMHNNKNNYIPGIYGLKLQNLHAKAIDYMISSIGEPDIDNLAIYKDRDQLFGIKHFDTDDLNNSINKLTTLSQKIVKRTRPHILVNSREYTFDRLAESMLELNRYPLLIVLNDDTDFSSLQTVHYSFRNIFSNDDFCTLYRKENDVAENIEFNQYIKDNNLNNPLAINSKIVYTSINKMSKTLLKSSWRPQAAILMGSMRSTKIDAYLQELDLVIHYDTDISPFKKYGTTQVIEKI
jgi:hypothetical protein|tara:strand:- start:386 stop:1606 length:1221 start_codon:yes stop_codon:yes gene_type:complete